MNENLEVVFNLRTISLRAVSNSYSSSSNSKEVRGNVAFILVTF